MALRMERALLSGEPHYLVPYDYAKSFDKAPQGLSLRLVEELVQSLGGHGGRVACLQISSPEEPGRAKSAPRAARLAPARAGRGADGWRVLGRARRRWQL